MKINQTFNMKIIGMVNIYLIYLKRISMFYVDFYSDLIFQKTRINQKIGNELW